MNSNNLLYINKNYGSKSIAFFLLLIYIASTLIFGYSEDIIYNHIATVLLWSFFGWDLIISKKKKLYTNNVVLGYLFFMLFSIASVFWSIDPITTFSNMHTIILVWLNLFIIYNLLHKYNIKNAIIYGVMLGAIVQYLIAFNLIHYSSQFTEHFKLRFVGTTSNPNVLAIYMLLNIMGSLISLQTVKRSVLKILLNINMLLSMYLIVMTASKKGLIFGFILLGISFIFSYGVKNLMILLGVIVVLLMFIDFEALNFYDSINYSIKRLNLFLESMPSQTNSGSTGERRLLIKEALNIFSFNPLIGTGQNTFYFQSSPGLYAHNNYAELLSNVGLIGVSLYYSMYYFISKQLYSSESKKLTFLITIFLFILLIMDMALVSYTFKIELIFLILFYHILFKTPNQVKIVKNI